MAEHLAFTMGRHVLVVMADMTAYCEAVRQVAAARGEIPGRRGYPGYLYSDLASLYERCGRLDGHPGSITQVPVLTMPAGDITHPVPDLTGYITEGQIVLTIDRHERGIYPPVEPLSSLSRLMRHGGGPRANTRGPPRRSRSACRSSVPSREVRQLSELLGESGLTATDRAFLTFADRFDTAFVSQRQNEGVGLAETFDRAWSVISLVPRRELTMLPAGSLDQSYSPPRELSA